MEETDYLAEYNRIARASNAYDNKVYHVVDGKWALDINETRRANKRDQRVRVKVVADPASSAIVAAKPSPVVKGKKERKCDMERRLVAERRAARAERDAAIIASTETSYETAALFNVKASHVRKLWRDAGRGSLAHKLDGVAAKEAAREAAKLEHEERRLAIVTSDLPVQELAALYGLTTAGVHSAKRRAMLAARRETT